MYSAAVPGKYLRFPLNQPKFERISTNPHWPDWWLWFSLQYHQGDIVILRSILGEVV